MLGSIENPKMAFLIKYFYAPQRPVFQIWSHIYDIILDTYASYAINPLSRISHLSGSYAS